jgi:ATP-dependent Clp protease adaptor protein ClpS
VGGTSGSGARFLSACVLSLCAPARLSYVTSQNSTPETEQGTNTRAESERAHVWRTVVHNDPVNLMTYVEWVFSTYFGFDPDTARRLMLQVHQNGRAVVSHGQREQMEADAQAMHTYGLWATIEPDLGD